MRKILVLLLLTILVSSAIGRKTVQVSEQLADLADGGRLDLILDSIDVNTSMIQADWTNGGRLDLILDRIDTNTAAIDVNTADIDVRTQTIEDYLDGTTTVAGHTYATVSSALDSNDADIFDVDGGAILITSFVGVVTTNITGATNNLEINLDADTGWTDYDFSTAVDIDGDAAGTRYVFTSVPGGESVLTPCEGADTGTATLMNWYCGEGMIEMDASDEDSAGAIKWYMTWIPYDDGTTVTAQ